MEDTARKYARIKYRLALVDIVYTLFLLAILQVSGLGIRIKESLSAVSDNQFVVAALYSAAIFIIYAALTFLLSFYRSFVVEHRFNLSRQGFFPWLADYAKGITLGLIAFTVLVEAFFFFAAACAGSWWWLSALFWIFFSVVVARIFPVVIIPLFYKYKRIEDEALRSRIMCLAQKMRVKILDVFEIDFSKKSAKANAAFVGLGGAKRVLLTDTLIRGKFSPEEIEVILAHEFAHYRARHLMKHVAINSCEIFLLFYVLSRLSSRGLDAGDIANLGTWLFLFMVIQLILAPFTNMISRAMEKNADMAAIKTCGKKETFISMMTKLGEQNLSEQRPPLWAKILFYDHPPIGERVAYAKNVRA